MFPGISLSLTLVILQVWKTMDSGDWHSRSSAVRQDRVDCIRQTQKQTLFGLKTTQVETSQWWNCVPCTHRSYHQMFAWKNNKHMQIAETSQQSFLGIGLVFNVFPSICFCLSLYYLVDFLFVTGVNHMGGYFQPPMVYNAQEGSLFSQHLCKLVMKGVFQAQAFPMSSLTLCASTSPPCHESDYLMPPNTPIIPVLYVLCKFLDAGI